MESKDSEARTTHGLPALFGPDDAAAILPEEIAPALLAVVLTTNRLMMLEALQAVPEARLTPPQFRILNFLLLNPGASVSAVAAHLGVRLPTASVMLVKLDTDGYIDRGRDPASRRLVRLVLTPHGQATIGAVRRAVFSRIDRARQQMSEADQQAVRQALPALRRLLQQA